MLESADVGVRCADSACPSGLGGIDCLLQTYPQPYGFRVKEKFWINVELNDVRPRGSDTLEFWFEVGLRFTRAPRTPLALLSMGNPCPVLDEDRMGYNGVLYAPPTGTSTARAGLRALGQPL